MPMNNSLNILDLLYFRDLERTYLHETDQNIAETINNVRNSIQGVWAIEENELKKTFDRIRNATRSELESGVFDEPTIRAYIEQVRSEVSKQNRSITEYQWDQEATDREKAYHEVEIYEKAYSLVHFMTRESEISESDKNLLKALLLESFSGEQGKETIQQLYQRFEKVLEKDVPTEEMRQNVSQFFEALISDQIANKKQRLLRLITKHSPEKKVSEQTLSEMLDEGVDQSGFSSYEERLTRVLADLEMTDFEYQLLTRKPDDYFADEETRKKLLTEKKAFLEAQEKKLQRILRDFEIEQMSVKELREKLIRVLSGNPELSEQVDQAITAHEMIGATPLELESQLNDLLAHPERAKQYVDAIQERSQRFLQGKDISKNPDPLRMVSEVRRFESVPQEKEYITGSGVLRDIDDQLERMEKLTSQSTLNDEQQRELSQLLHDVERLTARQCNLVDEVVNDEQGKPVLENGKIKTKQVEKALKLPPDRMARLEKAQEKSRQIRFFGKTKKVLESLSESPRKEEVEKALEAIFSDFYTIEGQDSKISSLKRIVKLMSLDHPVTRIRFNAGTKKPFMVKNPLTGKEEYQMHRLRSMSDSVTFQGRSQVLIKEMQQALLSHDVYRVQQQFQFGGLANRLYLDSLFFPAASLKDPGPYVFLKGKDNFGNDTFHRDQLSHQIAAHEQKHFDFFLDEKETEKRYGRDFQDEYRSYSGRLADEDDFDDVFYRKNERAILAKELDECLDYDPDGNPIFKKDLSPETLKFLQEWQEQEHQKGKILGAGPLGDTRITEERIKEINETSPLIALRAAQLKNELASWSLGGLQHGVRYFTDDARAISQTAIETMGNFWRDITFYSPMHIYLAVTQIYEQVSKIAEIRTKFWALNLLAVTFGAKTTLGAEFLKQAQQVENERMEDYKKSLAQYGNPDLMDAIYYAPDRFAFKGALSEAMDNRGIMTPEDYIDIRFIRACNKFHPAGYYIPESAFFVVPGDEKKSKETILNNDALKLKFMGLIEESIDQFWGKGQWQGWMNANTSKYESQRQQAFDTMKGYSPPLKLQKFKHYWEMLCGEHGGIEELQKIHPAVLVGHLEQEMDEGKNDSGNTFSVLQAMLCLGIVKTEHLIRLQGKYANQIPIHALIESSQADLCGLTDHLKRSLGKGNYISGPYNIHDEAMKNDFLAFYQGNKALTLEVIDSHDGKWGFPRTKAQQEAARQAGNLKKRTLTVHQLQKNRQAQEENYRRMDNSCIGLFIPAYSWSETQHAFNAGTDGKIPGARAHDIVAAYRGIHDVMNAYMNEMGDLTNQDQNDYNNFMLSVWYSYDAICKTQAMAGLLSRVQGRTIDYTTNQFDASPNFDQKFQTSGLSDGKSSFEKLVISGEGDQQRMKESARLLDGNDALNDSFRVAFKRMSGYQYVRMLGVDPKNGKNNPNPPHVQEFETYAYNPQESFKEVMAEFKKNIIDLAQKRSGAMGNPDFARRVAEAMERSKIDDFTNNSQRVQSVLKWSKQDCGYS